MTTFALLFVLLLIGSDMPAYAAMLIAVNMTPLYASLFQPPLAVGEFRPRPRQGWEKG